jgi:hypothetical protein
MVVGSEAAAISKKRVRFYNTKSSLDPRSSLVEQAINYIIKKKSSVDSLP